MADESHHDALDDAMEDRAANDRDAGLRVDLRVVLGALYRNRWLIATIVGLSLIAGIVALALTPPVYRARASVQIDQQAVRVLGIEDVEPTAGGTEADRFLQTQVDILKSRSLAMRVARDLNLSGDRAANFVTRMGQRVTGARGSALDGDVLNLLMSHMSVDVPRNSRVVGIEFDSRDPALAAQVANSFVTNFIDSNIQRKLSTSNYSRGFLQTQLADTKGRLEGSERNLNAYVRATKLIEAGGSATGTEGTAGPRSLTTANLVDANTAFTAARLDRLKAEERWNEARVTPLFSLPEVLANSAVQQLLQLRAQKTATLQRVREQYRTDHPQALQATAELEEINSQLQAIGTGIRNSIHSNYVTAARQETSLRGNVTGLQGASLAERDRGIQYNILKREVETNRQLYDGLLQRYKEVSAAAGVTNNNITVVDTAVVPGVPISPRPKRNVAVAVIAGILLAAAATLAHELFDDSIRSPDDVARKLGLPLLGTTPLVSDPTAAISVGAASPLREAYTTVRTALELSSEYGVASPLFITSSKAREGKTTTSIALARDFAGSGSRTLLIDADLRRPSLHAVLGRPNERGFSNLLARRESDATCIQRLDDQLDLLPSGPLPPSPTQLLAGSSLRELLERYTREYDMVVLDGPPVVGLADALRLSAVSGCCLFVVAANGAHRGAAKTAVRRLIQARAALAGAVLTKFDPRRAGYGNGPNYYYGYGDEDANG